MITSFNTPQPALKSVSPLTDTQIWDGLRKVMDPELNVDIVSLGLVYEVMVKTIQAPTGPKPVVHIVMTLTTPGCPLAGMFEKLVKDALASAGGAAGREGLAGLDIDRDVSIELTFDPPWIPDMMSAEAKAQLGFD